MKAVVKTKKEPGIEVLDVEVPEIRDTDILVKVSAGSLCGSDVHIYEWTPNYDFIPVPVTLGHEFSGEVVEVGARVNTVAVGDRITAMPGMACSRCSFCQMGKSELCTGRLSLGIVLMVLLLSTFALLLPPVSLKLPRMWMTKPRHYASPSL